MKGLVRLCVVGSVACMFAACSSDGGEVPAADSGTTASDAANEDPESDTSSMERGDGASDVEAAGPEADVVGSDTTAQDPSAPDTEADPVDPTWPEPTYGLSTQSLMHDGLTREYLLYVPESYTGQVSVPVVLNFHGGGMSASAMMEWTSDMRQLSEEEGFILAYPEGSPLDSGELHWNPIPPSADSKSEADDFGFVTAMLDMLAEAHHIDADRVYATGYSNGAGMAYGLLCYLSDRIAAAAPVSGSMYFEMSEGCQATQPKAVAVFNGTEDQARPYEGMPPWFLPVEDAVDFWVSHNGLTAEAAIESFDTNGLTVERRLFSAEQGSSAVALFKVIGGGHDWFGINIEGADLDRLIWDFLSAHNSDGVID